MAAITNGATNGCTFRWKIENISHSWLETEECMVSPSFIADPLEGTKWCLELYPMGSTGGENMSFFLHREIDCLGPTTTEVNYQLAFLGEDGSFLKEETTMERSFTKDQSWGFPAFELRETIVSERETFVPEDTLTVQCTIWKTGETLCKPKYSYARTIFKVNRRSFVWKIDEFSTLKTEARYKFKDDLIAFHLALNEMPHFTKTLDLDVISFDDSIKHFALKISIINSDGETEDCGAHVFLADDFETGIFTTPLFSEMLTENRAWYLPNDVLSLECEFVSSNGTVSYEFCSCGIISPDATKEEKGLEHCIEKDEPELSPVLVNDLKSVYDDRILSDTELRTATLTFPAHKIILSARSPVFRKMFTTDMKENGIEHIDITDFENDTIYRMLLYIYTDTVEDLQFENACKLYSAADKYEIMSLKSICSSFLKDNLCVTTACDVLVLADLHQDGDLKSVVQNYILKYDKEVFGSQQWKHFMASNLQLAADLMYRKVLSNYV